jgi:hypothetical protein
VRVWTLLSKSVIGNFFVWQADNFFKDPNV